METSRSAAPTPAGVNADNRRERREHTNQSHDDSRGPPRNECSWFKVFVNPLETLRSACDGMMVAVNHTRHITPIIIGACPPKVTTSSGRHHNRSRNWPKTVLVFPLQNSSPDFRHLTRTRALNTSTSRNSLLCTRRPICRRAVRMFHKCVWMP